MKKNNIKQAAKWIVFIIYLAILAYFVFFAELMDRDMLSGQYRYSLVPFREIMRFINNYDVLGFWPVFLNVAGNIIAFIPFGFCLPFVSEHKTKFFITTFLAFSFSLSIELVQLVSKVGCCDVDDLILNTFGGIIGYICFIIFDKIMKKRKK